MCPRYQLSFRYAISGTEMGREGGLQLLTAFTVDATELTVCVLDDYLLWVGSGCIITPQPLCSAIDSLLGLLFRQSPSPRGFALETTRI
jgi:hypothetical protein